MNADKKATSRIIIHLRSGAAIEINATEFTATRNGLGELVKINYKGSDVNLIWLSFKDVVAIVEPIEVKR